MSDSKEIVIDNSDIDNKLKFKLNKNMLKKFLFIICELSFIVISFFYFGNSLNRWFVETASASLSNDVSGFSSDNSEKTRIGNVNVLVAGIDSVEGTHRSDTIFILSINPSKSSISMLSVPRDTRVLVDGKGRKINEILPRYGQTVLKKLLEQLFKITINRFVEVGFQSFISVIDIMDGIDINIEKPMNYDDNVGNLHIHFKRGMNHLNGKKALEYVRFRSDSMADLGRIKRQQQFVKEVISKLSSPKVFVKVPKMISKALEEIKTDFTLTELLALVKSFPSNKIQFKSMSLPGEARYIDKISFFVPYQNEALDLGAMYFSDLTALELVGDY